MFSKRLKELRTEKALSQMQLSVETGISQSAIAKWELNKTEPSLSAIITLANYFGVSTDYLLGVKDY